MQCKEGSHIAMILAVYYQREHDDVIKWEHFPRYWPFVRGIHRFPVTRSFDIFFDLRLNKRLSKQSWVWWFETLSRPLWRHRNEISVNASFHNIVWQQQGRLDPDGLNRSRYFNSGSFLVTTTVDILFSSCNSADEKWPIRQLGSKQL